MHFTKNYCLHDQWHYSQQPKIISVTAIAGALTSTQKDLAMTSFNKSLAFNKLIARETARDNIYVSDNGLIKILKNMSI